MTTRLAEDSGCNSVGGFDTLGKGVSLGEALFNQLTATVDIGAGLEDHHDRGQPGQRFRSDHVHALDPVEQVLFQRDGDQLLDFLS